MKAMNRKDFLKLAFLVVGSAIPASSDNSDHRVYLFDELFTVWPGNDRLIYPKKESDLYAKVEEMTGDRLDTSVGCVYHPEHKVSLPIKDSYTMAEKWIISDRPLAAYPLGTKAKAIGGGYWEKVERGWKWCAGSTFPSPGGDWTGEVSMPKVSG